MFWGLIAKFFPVIKSPFLITIFATYVRLNTRTYLAKTPIFVPVPFVELLSALSTGVFFFIYHNLFSFPPNALQRRGVKNKSEGLDLNQHPKAGRSVCFLDFHCKAFRGADYPSFNTQPSHLRLLATPKNAGCSYVNPITCRRTVLLPFIPFVIDLRALCLFLRRVSRIANATSSPVLPSVSRD